MDNNSKFNSFKPDETTCLDSSPFPFLLINNKHEIIYANNLAHSTFNISEFTTTLESLFDDARKPLSLTLPEQNDVALFEFRFTKSDSKLESFKTYIKAGPNKQKDNVYYIWLEDNRLNEQHDNEMAQLAFIDPITGCFNRTYLSTVMPLSENTKYDLTLFYIDIDKFKTINDTYGHNIGDEILKKTGERLKSHTRSSDKVIRLGGDEFCVLAFSLIDNAMHIGEKLSDQLQKNISTSSGDFTLTYSIGIAKASKGSIILEHLINNADIAMYKSKKSTLQSCFEYEESFHKQRNPKGFSLKGELLEALNNREIFNVYQPIFNHKSELVSFEALARWYNKNEGLISPGVFIPLAEEQHLLSKLDNLVLDNVISFIKKANSFGSIVKPININFSAEHLVSNVFFKNLNNKLTQNNIPKNNIVIEVTESYFYEPLVLKTINELVENGFLVYMDDFGTEYSNLKTLSNVNLQVIKFDKSIIDSEELGDFSSYLTKACKSLGKKILFEGVEKKEDMNRAIKSHADFIQGFYLSKPITEEFAIYALKKINQGLKVEWPNSKTISSK